MGFIDEIKSTTARKENEMALKLVDVLETKIREASELGKHFVEKEIQNSRTRELVVKHYENEGFNIEFLAHNRISIKW